MSTFRLSHFSDPQILQSLHPERLQRFLRPYEGYLRSRGFTLPLRPSQPLEKLSEILLAPDDEIPHEFINALYYVDRMSHPQGMNDLLEAARVAGITFDCDELSAADVALQIWLERPQLLERLEAEQFLDQPRSFEYYSVLAPNPVPSRTPTEADHRHLEERLNDWFAQRHRGRTARVFPCDRNGVVHFLIRHGEPFRRQETVRGTEPSAVAYRPLTHDLVVYDPKLSELRIHAQLKGERALYRNEFSLYFFGEPGYFGDEAKFTLRPIWNDGEACLSCTDVNGLEKVFLKELHFALGGQYAAYRIDRANDLFAFYRDRGQPLIPAHPRVTRAVFSFWFPKAKRPRSVTIKLPNTALYTRKGDAGLVEQWLEKRGFLQVKHDADDSTIDPILVGA